MLIMRALKRNKAFHKAENNVCTHLTLIEVRMLLSQPSSTVLESGIQKRRTVGRRQKLGQMMH